MPKKRRAARRAKPLWERGYRSHGYWLGKECLGKVTLGAPADGELRYRWQVGNRAGKSGSLREAKQAVEHAVLVGTRQLALFEEGGER